MGYGKIVAMVAFLAAIAVFFVVVDDNCTEETEAIMVSAPVVFIEPSGDDAEPCPPSVPDKQCFDNCMLTTALIPEFIKLPEMNPCEEPQGVSEEEFIPPHMPEKTMPEEPVLKPRMDFISMLNLSSLHTSLCEYARDDDFEDLGDAEPFDEVEIALEDSEDPDMEIYLSVGSSNIPEIPVSDMPYCTWDAIGPIFC